MYPQGFNFIIGSYLWQPFNSFHRNETAQTEVDKINNFRTDSFRETLVLSHQSFYQFVGHLKKQGADEQPSPQILDIFDLHLTETLSHEQRHGVDNDM